METNFPFQDENEIDLGSPFHFIQTKVNSLPLDCGLFVAPFVPTTEEISKKAIEFADLKSSDVLIDLGCGDGIIFKHALCTKIGVELDDELYKYCIENYPDVKMIHCDMFTVDLMQLGCSVAVLYLLPGGLKKLQPMLKEWLNVDRTFRVVTIHYQIEAFKPVKSLTCTMAQGFTGGSESDRIILYYYNSTSY